jgi:hypothetical protein
MPYTMEDALRALDRKQGLDQQAAAGPKQLARMALLRGRHIAHLPYSEHPGSKTPIRIGWHVCYR